MPATVSASPKTKVNTSSPHVGGRGREKPVIQKRPIGDDFNSFDDFDDAAPKEGKESKKRDLSTFMLDKADEYVGKFQRSKLNPTQTINPNMGIAQASYPQKPMMGMGMPQMPMMPPPPYSPMMPPPPYSPMMQPPPYSPMMQPPPYSPMMQPPPYSPMMPPPPYSPMMEMGMPYLSGGHNHSRYFGGGYNSYDNFGMMGMMGMGMMGMMGMPFMSFGSGNYLNNNFPFTFGGGYNDSSFTSFGGDGGFGGFGGFGVSTPMMDSSCFMPMMY